MSQSPSNRHWRIHSPNHIGKAISTVVLIDVRKSVGAQQLCAGHTFGCEAAVHAIGSIFNAHESEGVLTVDATNAFNLFNRKMALHNIIKLCPPLGQALLNTYRSDIDLYVNGEVL